MDLKVTVCLVGKILMEIEIQSFYNNVWLTKNLKCIYIK